MRARLFPALGRGHLPGQHLMVRLTADDGYVAQRHYSMTAAHVAPLLAEQPPGGWEAYVCGSNGFAEHASRLLVEAGQPVDRIRIERFG
ncbi:hypothetical protein C4B68_36690 [Streptomyces dengpaensis]|uniref:Oxidoreductase FAD/NAD(P)-binding domain-containing protein n=1 Tax=Streptomyces dengpaensis TaxID=2049881 RepID=A0ABM6T388_9ACTN|nr:hypothetical protein C4B68_36690 [Streptomyces dengpaensis]